MALIENILLNPLFWILGGILLLFLSPIFYLVYCAVCHLWFPKREPGYPFESTQYGNPFESTQYGNPFESTQNFDEKAWKKKWKEQEREEEKVARKRARKTVRTRLKKFNFSAEEAELVFGKEWRDILGKEHQLFFWQIQILKGKLMDTGFDQMFTNNPEPLFWEKVSHIIDKVLHMTEYVYNEDPDYAQNYEKLWEEKFGKWYCDDVEERWEFFKKHKRSRPWNFSFSSNTPDTSKAYKILGLAITATIEEVKKKYRELVLKWHPDRNRTNKTHAEKELVKINLAYETIMVAC